MAKNKITIINWFLLFSFTRSRNLKHYFLSKMLLILIFNYFVHLQIIIVIISFLALTGSQILIIISIIIKVIIVFPSDAFILVISLNS